MRKFLLISVFFLTAGQCAKAQQDAVRNTMQPQVRIVRFYPNPATSFINFEFKKPSNDQYRFRVFNFLGKKVMELPKINGNSRVDLADFTRGIYIFQVMDQHGKVIESGKFQVEKH
jgi:hypothetical protein